MRLAVVVQKEENMPERASRYRWFVVAVFFVFMLLHQTDRLMIGPMQDTIEKQFGINDQQWGFINSGALLVGTVLYPIWGYLYDRYARAKLLALASFIWGGHHLDQRHRTNVSQLPGHPCHDRH